MTITDPASTYIVTQMDVVGNHDAILIQNVSSVAENEHTVTFLNAAGETVFGCSRGPRFVGFARVDCVIGKLNDLNDLGALLAQ